MTIESSTAQIATSAQTEPTPSITPVSPELMARVLARRFAEDGDLGHTARIGVREVGILEAISAIGSIQGNALLKISEDQKMGNSKAIWREIAWALGNLHQKAKNKAAAEAASVDW
jgi:hypothetical protein